jgi:hypothetical protein
MKSPSFFLLFLFTTKVIAACVDIRTDVSYDIMLSQHPDLTCQEVIARANRLPSEVTIYEIDEQTSEQITLLSNIRREYNDLKQKVSDGLVEFDQAVFDEFHQKMAGIQVEIDRLNALHLTVWRRNRDDYNARVHREKELRTQAREQVRSLDSQYSTCLKEKRTAK